MFLSENFWLFDKKAVLLCVFVSKRNQNNKIINIINFKTTQPMKKLLSLLCALTLVVGVNAAPKKEIRASKFTAVHASGLNQRTDKAKALKTVNLAKEAVRARSRAAFTVFIRTCC